MSGDERVGGRKRIGEEDGVVKRISRARIGKVEG